MRIFNFTGMSALHRVTPQKRYLGYFIILAIFGLITFRASYQSIVHDEAVTYNLFVARGLSTIFLSFYSNNHTLNTFLMWLSTSIFGLSIFNLRLPALLGGAIYLIASEHICDLSFKNMRQYVLGLLALSSSPFLLDYMTVARGYSLALGFFMLALLYVWQQVSAKSGEIFYQEILISILAALSVSANLSFAFINAALLLTYCFFRAIAYYRKELALKQLVLKYFFLSVPGGLLYFIITPSILYFSSQSLYFGTGSWRRTFDSIMTQLFDDFRPQLLTENWQQFIGGMLQYLPYFLILLIIAAGISLLPKYIRSFVSNNSMDRSDSLWLLIACNLFFTFILFSAARMFFGILLPRDRTGIYLVPLFILITCLSIANLQNFGFQKLLRVVGEFCLLVMIAYFGLCLRVSNTHQWVNDAGIETTFKILLSNLEQHPGANVATNWVFEPEFNFYRMLYKIDNLNSFKRNNNYDEFQLLVLLPTDDNDDKYIKSHSLKVLYTNPESGAIIALNNQQ